MKIKITFLAMVLCVAFNISFGQYTKLMDFESIANGIYPEYGALISDGTYLYGTTSNGGDESDGVLFKIKRDGTDYQKIYDFTDDISNVPESGVILVDGYLYGTTKYGGAFGFGTVYKIKTDGTDFSIIANFDREVNGSDLIGSLYYDGAFFYGMAPTGGVNNGGTIYKLSADGSYFTTIMDFNISEEQGNSPNGHLISDGTYLYGMTVGGGSINQGTVFKIKPDGTGYELMMSFTDDPNGSWGYGSLVYDGSTYLYAMTNNGGEYNRGTIFKIKTDGTGYEKLLDMNNTDGAQPLGSLVLVGSTLYGLTELGSEDFDAKGNMYSIETDGSNFQTLIDFDGDNGAYPYGTLLYEDGAFFGFTKEGGTNNYGVIFRYGDIIESVEEINLSGISIYPNPAHGKFNIKLNELNSGEEIAVEIYNAAGEKIYTGTLQSDNAEIATENLATGIYFVKIICGEKTYTDRVVME